MVNFIKPIALDRRFSVCLFAVLCSCLGCGEQTGTTPSNSGSPVETSSSLDADAELSADQLFALAYEKLDAEKYEDAIDLFERLVERNPTATTYAMLGDCFWKQQKLEQADVHYRQALALDPQHCGANHALGRNAVLLERHQDAIPFLDTANKFCEGTPVYAQNLRFRVAALTQLDRLEEAHSDMRKLLSEYPEDPSTFEAGILLASKEGDDILAAEYQRKLDAITGDGPQSPKTEP